MTQSKLCVCYNTDIVQKPIEATWRKYGRPFASVFYYMKCDRDCGPGHAIALGYDGSDRVCFFDPNYMMMFVPFPANTLTTSCLTQKYQIQTRTALQIYSWTNTFFCIGSFANPL